MKFLQLALVIFYFSILSGCSGPNLLQTKTQLISDSESVWLFEDQVSFYISISANHAINAIGDDKTLMSQDLRDLISAVGTVKLTKLPLQVIRVGSCYELDFKILNDTSTYLSAKAPAESKEVIIYMRITGGYKENNYLMAVTADACQPKGYRYKASNKELVNYVTFSYQNNTLTFDLYDESKSSKNYTKGAPITWFNTLNFASRMWNGVTKTDNKKQPIQFTNIKGILSYLEFADEQRESKGKYQLVKAPLTATDKALGEAFDNAMQKKIAAKAAKKEAEDKAKKEQERRQQQLRLEKEATEKREQAKLLAKQKRIELLGLVKSAPQLPSNFNGMYIVHSNGSIDQMTSNNKGRNIRDVNGYGLNQIYIKYGYNGEFEYHRYFNDFDIKGFYKKNRVWKNCDNMWSPKIDYQLVHEKDKQTAYYYKNVWRIKQKTVACHKVQLHSPDNGYDCTVSCQQWKSPSNQDNNNLILTSSKEFAFKFSDMFKSK